MTFGSSSPSSWASKKFHYGISERIDAVRKITIKIQDLPIFFNLEKYKINEFQ